MAERRERLRHLVPVGTSITERYTNPQRFPTCLRFPGRNRQAHGTYLQHRLELMRSQAVELGRTRVAFGLDADESICLEFVGEAGYDLAVRSLEHAGQGIQLLMTRRRDNLVSATVYVPPGKVEYFLRRVEQYLREDTRHSQPKHQQLVEGIADVRMVVLEAFWSDSPSLIPPPEMPVWWEVWLRVETTPDPLASAASEALLASFRAHATTIGLTLGDPRMIIQFPERLVVLVHGTLEQMARSVELLNVIAELRLARIRVEDFLDLRPPEQAAWVLDLRHRTVPPPPDAPAICLLDTGVIRAHPLLDMGLHEDDCHTYHPAWGTADQHGHGTAMAGIALYGDVAETLMSANDVVLAHRLESVKILPPEGHPPHDPLLYGSITQQAIARAEIQAPRRPRVVCMTVTGAPPDHLRVTDVSSDVQGADLRATINTFYGRGRPSSWSAAIDQLASGAFDEQCRLIVLPAGNTQPWSRRYYPDSNLTECQRQPEIAIQWPG